jgi:hypothetical protein
MPNSKNSNPQSEPVLLPNQKWKLIVQGTANMISKRKVPRGAKEKLEEEE